MLIILSGLPGVGKTTLARELAKRIAATYIRIDTIEQAVRNSSLNIQDIEDSGYLVGYALAADNLEIGRTVVADSVNSIEITRKAWLDVAERIGKQAIEVEVICSNKNEHKTRIETRVADIEGHKLPNWQNILDREYDSWERERIIIDTADKSVEECITQLLSTINIEELVRK